MISDAVGEVPTCEDGKPLIPDKPVAIKGVGDRELARQITLVSAAPDPKKITKLAEVKVQEGTDPVRNMAEPARTIPGSS